MKFSEHYNIYRKRKRETERTQMVTMESEYYKILNNLTEESRKRGRYE